MGDGQGPRRRFGSGKGANDGACWGERRSGDMASRSSRPRGRLLCALAGDFPREGNTHAAISLARMLSGPEAEPDRRRAGGMIIQWRRRRSPGRETCGPRPGPSAVLRRAAPQAALEVGRVPHGRVRADERVPAGAAALHEPRVVVHLAREGLAAGGAGPRGGGTLLRGFVETRVDAADARIPPLSAFSHVQMDFAKVKAWSRLDLPRFFFWIRAADWIRAAETSRKQPYDYIEPFGCPVKRDRGPRVRTLKFTPPRRPRRRRPPWRPRSLAGRGSPSRPRTRRRGRSAGL